jgi:hypothetical protein
VNAAQQGRKPKRTEKHDKALNSAEAKLAKKNGNGNKKSMGSKIRDILKGNA